MSREKKSTLDRVAREGVKTSHLICKALGVEGKEDSMV